MTGISAQRAMRTEDLLVGTLAALALKGVDTIKTADKSFHASFGSALETFRKAGGELADLANCYYRDVVSRTYDELDHALISAEQFGLVRFPNPSYSRLQITISRRVANQLLADLAKYRPVFEEAANKLQKTTYQ